VPGNPGRAGLRARLKIIQAGTEAGPTDILPGPDGYNDARLPARLRPRFQPVGLPGRRVGDYAPVGRAYSSERRTALSVVAASDS